MVEPMSTELLALQIEVSAYQTLVRQLSESLSQARTQSAVQIAELKTDLEKANKQLEEISSSNVGLLSQSQRLHAEIAQLDERVKRSDEDIAEAKRSAIESEIDAERMGIYAAWYAKTIVRIKTSKARSLTFKIPRPKDCAIPANRFETYDTDEDISRIMDHMSEVFTPMTPSAIRAFLEV